MIEMMRSNEAIYCLWFGEIKEIILDSYKPDGLTSFYYERGNQLVAEMQFSGNLVLAVAEKADVESDRTKQAKLVANSLIAQIINLNLPIKAKPNFGPFILHDLQSNI